MARVYGSQWKHPNKVKTLLGQYNWTKAGDRFFELTKAKGDKKAIQFNSVQDAIAKGWKRIKNKNEK